MKKLIVAIVIVAAVAYAWHKGWIGEFGEWLERAAVSGADSVKRTQREATTVKPVDPDAPAEKK